MAIELAKTNVIPAILRQAQDGEHRRTKAGIYLNRFGSSSGMIMGLLSVMMLSSSFLFVYFSYPNHWSTTRGIISQKLTEEYISSSLERHSEILDWANDFKGNPEVYFSSMMGRQFKVLDRVLAAA